MRHLPLFHNYQGKRALCVGGGKVAARRVHTLQEAGLTVDVIAPCILPALTLAVTERGGQCFEHGWRGDETLQTYVLVIAATDQHAINQAIAARAKQCCVPVNVADDAASCDFVFPTIIDRSPLTIAVASGVASPLLSVLLKQRIEALVPASYGRLADLLGEFRATVRAKIADAGQRTDFWRQVLQGHIAESVLSGKPDHARQLLQHALDDPQHFVSHGEVYLIGAGPGDPDLLTLRATRLLQQADVVLYDRLVSPAVLEFARMDAEKLYVGKRRSEHSVPQEGINQLLVDYAKQGKRVARLKGGDPFIFGRGGEEIEQLADEKIPFQVVPGITAASGCASYCGIPLTHRDYARSVRFVPGQLKDGSLDLPWQELVADDLTVVFYMGLHAVAHIADGLIQHGRRADTPIALIEHGTLPEQRVYVSTLQTIARDIEGKEIHAPTLLIVGQVVSLHEKLAWFAKA